MHHTVVWHHQCYEHSPEDNNHSVGYLMNQKAELTNSVRHLCAHIDITEATYVNTSDTYLDQALLINKFISDTSKFNHNQTNI
jgi:hypothetical protein